jgi:hypothetical protein
MWWPECPLRAQELLIFNPAASGGASGPAIQLFIRDGKTIAHVSPVKED